MTKILSGVRVLEVSTFGFVPSAGAVLREWGAEVMKVEDPNAGDPIRGVDAFGAAPGVGGVTSLWEVFNRGKRSIGLDLRSDEGRKVLFELVDRADVFLTNFLEPARRRLGIDVDDVAARNPRVIYARGTGQGPAGPDADKGGFDSVSYWSRSGVSLAARPIDYDRPIDLPGPAFGDSQAGMHLAGGVAAALFHRERTGEGTVVDVSLLAAGLWAMQASLAGVHVLDRDEMPKREAGKVGSPLGGAHRTSDGHFIMLSMIEAERYWPTLRGLIADPEIDGDERFRTTEGLFEHKAEAIAVLSRVFARRTLTEWTELLGRQEGQWSVIQTPRDAISDPQAVANGYVQLVDYENGATLPLVSAPVQFDTVPPTLTPAPDHGAHTDETLLDIGYSWPALIALKEKGVIT